MDKNAMELEEFEGILRNRTDRKPLALYDTKDLRSSSTSNTLKPQDVISAVSRQLREIQKADNMRKERNLRNSTVKHQKSEFIPIHMLSKQQTYHQQHCNKFETQCVSDTQLIDVVDRVEAMVDNGGITQEFEKTFCPKSTEKEILANICSVGEKTSIVDHDKTELKECSSNDIEMGKDTGLKHIENNIILDIDEINTEVCQEFQTSYCQMEINYLTSNINKQSQLQMKTDKEENINKGTSYHGDVKDISETCMCEPKILFNPNCNGCSNSLSKCNFSSTKDTQTVQHNVTADFDTKCKETDTENIKEENNLMQTSKERSEPGITSITTPVFEVKEIPCSPVFKYFKTRRKSPSPLVCTLDSFEKFESLVMPLIEENLDFEAAKHLINSQIMNMELVIGSSSRPTLDNPKDNLVPATINSSSVNKIDLLEKNNNQEGCVGNVGKEFQEPTQDNNNKQSIDDEIIFSSDEENDYLHCGVEDLPMTCRLKNSINESDVFELDQTMFVGFQTASNECIQVNKDSFVKAKCIFHNISLQSNDNLSVTELVDLYDGGTVQLSNKSDEAIISQGNQKEIAVLPESRCDSKFIGFKTANGKSIDISKKALQSSKDIFKDIGDNLFTDVATCSEVVSARKRAIFEKAACNKRPKLSEDLFPKSSNIVNNIDLNLNDKPDNYTPDTILTAKNDENIDKGDHSNIVDQILLQEFENESLEESSENLKYSNSFVGFKIASKKNIKISESALKRSMNIFKDIDKISEADVKVNFDPGIEKDIDHKIDIRNSPKNTTFSSFKTASNKEIKISENAYSRIKDIYKDIEFEDICGKKINVNLKNTDEVNSHINENINKLKKKPMAENLEMNRVIGSSLSVLTKTSTICDLKDKNSNVYCNISVKNPYPDIAETKKNVPFSNTTEIQFNTNNFAIRSSKSESWDNSNKSSATTFQGFKTASNKTVKVSEEALLRSINMFKDIDTNDTIKKNLKHNESCLNDNIPLNTSSVNQYPTTFGGFKTANNKPVKISEEALARTKSVFQDIDISAISEKTKSHQSAKFSEVPLDSNAKSNILQDNNLQRFQGFKTASNRSIQVSKEALLKTKNIFKDVENNVKYDQPNNIPTEKVFKGFKTAGNKPAIISEEALLKTKRMFEDISCDSNSNIKHNMLQTSGDSLYTAHDTCLKSNDDTEGRNVAFKGFTTANNKKVKIFEDSLARTKLIFKDFDLFNTGDQATSESEVSCVKTFEANTEISKENNHAFEGFKGFQTASNKCVKVSEEAMLISRKLFDDLNVENNGNLISRGLLTEIKPIEPEIGCVKTSEAGTERNKGNNHAFKGFKGFQTASNKGVKVSEEAIVRNRKLFDDLNVNDSGDLISGDLFTKIKPNLEKENVRHSLGNAIAPNFGFKTATNKTIKISEDALKKSRKLFAEMDNFEEKEENYIADKPSSDIKQNPVNIGNILNTQVINNFEETLHSEDFQKDVTPKQCKRSGSPILSCPKAKKRKKFETPHRNDSPNITTPKNVCNAKSNAEFKYSFSKNYKKAKLYTLKDIDSANEKLDPYILNFDYDTLLNFAFEGNRNDLTDVRWTTDKLKECFVESVNKKIIPDGWLDNHLKLILWKLISYEIRFPKAMKGVCTVRNVLEQLKYRYDKELYNVERPALRKLLEKDDVSTRTMILAVVGIYADGVKVDSVASPSSAIELLLTDGWYCVKATADAMISGLVREGKIAVGRKLATVGAELVGCEQGIAPWEDTSAVRLKIYGNSTRPARWDAPLGYYSRGAIASRVRDIRVSGGKAMKLRLFVVRVYPALYVQRFEDGSTVTRSERLENLHQMKYETERQLQLEKLYEEVEREFHDQESSGSEGVDTDLKRTLLSGSQLHKKLKRSKDPHEFQSYLTESQSTLLKDYTCRRNEKFLEELQKRVLDRIEKRGLNVGRNVIPLLKVRVAGVEGEDVVVTKAMLSIWRPCDAVLDIVKEGTWIDVFNVVPTAIRNSELQLSAGRQSVFLRSKFKENNTIKPYTEALQRKCYTTKELHQNPTMTTDYNEIDTLGIVFQIEPSTKEFENSKSQFQNVYLTDLDKHFVCINFWGGLKKFGYENIFETSSIIVCMNLQKRAGNTRKSIPQYRATELSVFTKTPKLEYLRKMADDLVKQFSGLDKRKFCNDCVLIKNNYATIRQTENISPYRLNTSDFNITKNKIFIDSPLAQRNDINFNLTGLDFESTFKQADSQELSPARLKQKQRVNEKIAKLKMYGEPPPLSKVYMVNKSKNACSAYKSPLTTNTSNVAILKNVNDSPVTTNRLNVNSSPVLSMNRTFVIRPGVNPVKLNFSHTSTGDEKDKNDPFEEEFDCSPPLSLDCNEL